MKRSGKWKKFLSVLLALTMALSIDMPLGVRAEEDGLGGVIAAVEETVEETETAAETEAVGEDKETADSIEELTVSVPEETADGTEGAVDAAEEIADSTEEAVDVAEETVDSTVEETVDAAEEAADSTLEEAVAMAEDELPVYESNGTPAIYHAGKGQREKTTIYQGANVLDIYVTPSYHVAEMTAYLPTSMCSLIETGNQEDASFLRVKVKYREQGGEWNTNTQSCSFDKTDYTAKLSFSYLESGTTYEFEISLEHKVHGSDSYSYNWVNLVTFQGSGTPVRTTTLTSTEDVLFEVQQTGSLVSVYSCIPNPGTNGTSDWGVYARKKGDAVWGNYEKVSELSYRGEALDYFSVEPDTDYEFAVIHHTYGEEEDEPAAYQAVHTGAFPANIQITPKNITKSTADVEVSFSNFTGLRLIEFDGSYRVNYLQFRAKTEGRDRIDRKLEKEDSVNVEANATSGTITLPLKDLDAGRSYSLPIWVHQTGSNSSSDSWYLAGTANFTTQSSEIAGKVGFSVEPKAGSSTALDYHVSINPSATDHFADSYSYDVYYRLKDDPDSPDWHGSDHKVITKDTSKTPNYQASDTILDRYAGATYLVYLVIDDKVYTREVSTADGTMKPTITLTPLQYGARLDVRLDGAAKDYKIKAYSSSQYGALKQVGLADVGNESSRDPYKTLGASESSGNWIARGFVNGISSNYTYYDPYYSTYKPDTDYLFWVKILDENDYAVYEKYIPYHTKPIELEVRTQSISGTREKVIVCFSEPDASVQTRGDSSLPMSLYYRVKGSDSAWKKDTSGLWLSSRVGYEYGYNQDLVFLADTKLKKLSADTTYELKITSKDYEYGDDDAIYATAEFTTTQARENGAFKDVELVFNGFEAQVQGTYLMSDYADHARVYLQQLDQSGAVVYETSIYPNETTGVFSTYYVALKKETESVRLHADEYARGWSYDDEDDPVKTTNADSYTRPGKPQVEFTAAKVTPGVNRLFVNLAYTGDMCLSENNMGEQSMSVALKYGTGTDESQWSTKYCYDNCFYRYGDQQQNVIVFKDLEARTTYHGKVLVRVMDSYSSEEEFYRWEIDLGTFTTGTDDTYTLATIFPDEALRNMVIYKADLDSSATQITASQLEKITSLQSYRYDFDDPAVKSLAGLEKLKALQYLDLERHEISDGSNVDWSKLAMLVCVELQGNDLTQLPDLSGNVALVSVDFSQNKLSAAELATASSKIPAGVNASYYNQRPDGLTVIVEDTYYQRSGQSVLACKLTGYKSSLPYTFKYKVDGKEITDWGSYSIDIYYHENTGLTVGTHSLVVEMYADDEMVETSAAKTFTIAAAKATAYKPLYYWNSNQSGISIELYTDKPFNGISMRKSGSQTVVARPDEPVDCYSTYEESRYRKLGYISLSDTEIYRGGAWLEKVDNATLEKGSYDVVVEYKDGSTETITGLVTVTDSAVITGGSSAHENYDNAGEYIYLYISGYAFDPARLAFTFENTETGVAYDATYVSAKQDNSHQVLKFRKGENWMADIRKGKGNYVTVKMAAAGGYSAVFETDSFEAGGTSDLPYLAYNPAAGNIEARVSSKLSGTALTYTLRRYDSSSEMWNDYYDTSGESIALQVEKTRGTLSYLKPVKDGNPYALPAGYYKVRLKYRGGGETSNFRVTGEEPGKQLSVYANNSTLPATLKLYRPYDTDAAATVTITQSDLESGRYHFTRSLIEQLTDRKALYELVITYADGYSRYFEKMSLGTADGAEDEPSQDDPEPPAEVRYTVTFSMQGHGGAVPAQNVKYGEKATEPPAPTAAGYRFGGWYKDSGYQTKWNFASDTITKPTTIYARWLAEYAITYMDGNTVMTGLTPAVYAAGTAVRLPAPTKTGYIFKGWYEASDLSGTAVTSIAADSTGAKTFYAKWAVAHKITYMDGETAMTGLSPAVYEEGATPNLATPTKKGYKFDGWYAAKELTGEAVTKVPEGSKADLVYYAKWTQLKTYSITYMDGETAMTGLTPATYEEGTTPSLPTTATKEGYTFGGWYAAKELTGDAVTKVPEGSKADLVYYAKWTAKLKNFKVTFNTDGGSAVAEQTVEEGKTATKPAADPTKKGFIFGGWYADAACATAYDFAAVLTADVTIYAKWTPEPPAVKTFTVTFDVNGGSAVAAQTVEDGKTATRPSDPTKSGFTFGGWYTDAACKTAYKFETAVTADVTVYAKWTETGKDGFWVSAVEPQDYTGSAIKPAVKVYDGTELLREKTDYTVAYKNNTDAGNATIEVTGKGNYTGKETVTFVIRPMDLNSDDITMSLLWEAYTGSAVNPVPTVKFGSKALKNGTDFTLSYPGSGYVEEGTYPVKVTGAGNFTGDRTLTFGITKAKLISGLKVSSIKNQSYTGDPVTPEVTVKDGKKTLERGTDYELSYRDNVDAGKATVIITGMGDTYAGVKEVTFTITGTQISKAQISGVATKTYNGRPQTQENLKLTYKGETLDEEEDYTVSYSKNVEAGTATIILTGRKGFTGTKKKTFRIEAYDIGNDPDGLLGGGLADDSAVYTKGGSMPEVAMTFDGDPMRLKLDYSVSYTNNKKIASSSAKKAPTVTVNGKGNFKGKRKFTFDITKNNLNNDGTVFVTVPDVKYAKGKGKYISKPVLIDSTGKKLTAGKDYNSKIVYTLEDDTELGKKDTVPAGQTVTATITGKGCYEGTLEVTYRITEKSFGSAQITIKPQEYTGEAVTLEPGDVTVTMGGSTLTYGTDYEIVEGSYLNNTKTGKNAASVIIRGLGEYGGNKTAKFTINAKKID